MRNGPAKAKGGKIGSMSESRNHKPGVLKRLNRALNRMRKKLLRREKLVVSLPRSTYINPSFARHMDKALIKVAFEIGSRDARDAVAVRDFYTVPQVFCMECNPEALVLCRETLSGEDNIFLVEKYLLNKYFHFFPYNIYILTIFKYKCICLLKNIWE